MAHYPSLQGNNGNWLFELTLLWRENKLL
jgi:hypothetical protein